MPRFRTKTTEVEAVRYVAPDEDLSQTRLDRQGLEDWGAPVTATEDWGNGSPGEWNLILVTDEDLQLEVFVHPGDWVLRTQTGVSEGGEATYDYERLSNEDFHETYEAVDG